jgi:hypothetical protein
VDNSASAGAWVRDREIVEDRLYLFVNPGWTRPGHDPAVLTFVVGVTADGRAYEQSGKPCILAWPPTADWTLLRSAPREPGDNGLVRRKPAGDLRYE